MKESENLYKLYGYGLFKGKPTPKYKVQKFLVVFLRGHFEPATRCSKDMRLYIQIKLEARNFPPKNIGVTQSHQNKYSQPPPKDIYMHTVYVRSYYTRYKSRREKSKTNNSSPKPVSLQCVKWKVDGE